jgi:hypothetical protein
MGIAIVEVDHPLDSYSGATFLQTTSMDLFGPLMRSKHTAQRFRESLDTSPTDLHRRGELVDRYDQFITEWDEAHE